MHPFINASARVVKNSVERVADQFPVSSVYQDLTQFNKARNSMSI